MPADTRASGSAAARQLPEPVVDHQIDRELSPAATFFERLFTVGWVLFALLMLLTITPASWGFSGWPLVLHLTSFPLAFGSALAVLAVFLGFRALSKVGRLWRVRLIAALLIAAVAAGQAGIVVRRGGWWSTDAARKPGDLVIIAFNTAGVPLSDEVANVVVRYRPDAVVLPETTRFVADVLASAVADRGRDFQVFTAPTNSLPPSPTSMLISSELGEYEMDRAGSLANGVIKVVPAAGNDGPVIIGVHPESPDLFGFNARNWQAAGRAAVAQCSDNPGAIVAGDFNATLDHPQLADLGGCRDVAALSGQSARGTWPAWLPSPLASAIDHVIFDGEAWNAVNFDTLRVGNSDHRLIVATIRPR